MKSNWDYYVKQWLSLLGYLKNDLTCLMVRLDPHGWIDICPHEHKCQLHKTCKLWFLYCLVTCHVHMDSFHPHGTFHWQKICNWEKISYTVTQELNELHKWSSNTCFKVLELHSLLKILDRYPYPPEIYDKFLLTPTKRGDVIDLFWKF